MDSKLPTWQKNGEYFDIADFDALEDGGQYTLGDAQPQQGTGEKCFRFFVRLLLNLFKSSLANK